MDSALFPDHAMQDTLAMFALATHQIGTPAFPKTIAHICQSASAYDGVMVYAFSTDEVPALLFSNLPETDVKTCWPPYFAGAYLLDPFYALFRSQAADGLYRLRDLAPDDFYRSQYHKSFYLQTGLRDEVAMVVNMGHGMQVHLSLGLRAPRTSVSDADIQRLSLLTPLLAAQCHRHWDHLHSPQAGSPHRMGAHLDNAFQRFGSSKLSEREAEISRLILMGHSGKSIARALNLSPETVKVYRKRVHSKLQIRSQAELFSMFLSGVQNTPIGVDKDPLEFI